MRNYLALVRKDLYTLFVSPIAYFVLAVFFALSGVFFYLISTTIIQQAIQLAIQSQQFGAEVPPLDVPALILRNYFGVLSTLLLFFVPVVTMAVFAEEKKRGTIELLMTSPLTNFQLVMGKFSAVFCFLVLMLIPTVLKSGFLFLYSEPVPPLAPALVGFLGALLLGGSLLAVGVFVSSVTENQIVAAVLTFGIFLVLWILDAAAGTGTTLMNETLRYLSILNHYEDFTRGVLDTQHVVFYLSLISMGLFLTSVSLDSIKWRQ